MKQNFDVDIVIPWVDGGDKNWQEEKNKYLPAEKQIDVDASISRYRDWDNLKYVFRGIEKFAPWVRKVFFVTCGQTPTWLNTNNPKLVLVNHKDYIPKKYLPTFSANPIELNMHRIEGLSEHFIYINDDFFFTKPVTKEDFFINGKPRLIAMEKPKTVSTNVVFDCLMANNVRTIMTKFEKYPTKKANKKKWYSLKNPIAFFVNKFYDYTAKTGWAGFYMDHLQAPFLKSAIEECWKEFGNVLDATSKNKFRSVYDVNQYLFTEYLLCTGNFELDKFKRKGKLLNIFDGKQNNVDYVCNVVKTQKYKMLCLNDAVVENFEDTKGKVNSALDTILPEKSSFEL